MNRSGGCIEKRQLGMFEELCKELDDEYSRVGAVDRSTLTFCQRKLYDAALAAGLENPLPVYVNNTWSLHYGPDRHTVDLGFNLAQSLRALKEGVDVFGSKIIVKTS